MNRRSTIVLVLVAAFALAGEDADKKTEKKNPDTAPAFTLPDFDGKKHSLKDYTGKLVVLEWTNHGCPFVKKHYDSGNMQKLQTEYRKKDVIWLTICSSAKGKQGFMTAKDWKATNKRLKSDPTAVLLDPKGTVGRLYEASRTPQICIIDKKGIRVYEGAIDDKRSANTADVKTSKNYVRTVLDAVLAGKKSPVRKTTPYGCSVKYEKK
jgi:peroxiredoxin